MLTFGKKNRTNKDKEAASQFDKFRSQILQEEGKANKVTIKDKKEVGEASQGPKLPSKRLSDPLDAPKLKAKKPNPIQTKDIDTDPGDSIPNSSDFELPTTERSDSQSSIFDVFDSQPTKSPVKRIHMLSLPKDLKQTKLSFTTGQKVQPHPRAQTKVVQERPLIPFRRTRNIITYKSQDIAMEPKQELLSSQLDSQTSLDSPDFEQELDEQSDSSDLEPRSKGIHELRQAGSSKRQSDELEYLFEGLSQKPAVVRSALFEILQKFKHKDFITDIKSKGYIRILYKTIQDGGDYVVKYALIACTYILANELGMDLFMTIVDGYDFFKLIYDSLEHFKKSQKTKFVNQYIKDIDAIVSALNLDSGLEEMLIYLFNEVSKASEVHPAPSQAFLDLIQKKLQSINLETTSTKKSKRLSITSAQVLVLSASYHLSCISEGIPIEYYQKNMPKLEAILLCLLKECVKSDFESDLLTNANFALNTIMNSYGPEHKGTESIDLDICGLMELYIAFGKNLVENMLDSFVIFTGMLVNVLQKNQTVFETARKQLIDDHTLLRNLCENYKNVLDECQGNIVCAYGSILLGVLLSNSPDLGQDALEFLKWEDFGVLIQFIDDYVTCQKELGKDLSPELSMVILGLRI